MVVDHHGHEGHDVFPIIGAHVIGMYAFVIVIGDFIDRIGRAPSLAGGLFVMAVSVISLLWVESVPGDGSTFAFVLPAAVEDVGIYVEPAAGAPVSLAEARAERASVLAERASAIMRARNDRSTATR